MNLIANISRLRRARLHAKNKRGVAAVEFALTLPIWIILLLGVSDGAYCMIVNERIDRIAYTVTDVVTQYTSISLANLNDIVQAAGQLMQPLTFGNDGLVIVTSVYKPTGQSATIKWQYTGGGSGTFTSNIGSVGGTPQLPNGLTLNDNDNVIISEVYYNYKPLFVSEGLFSNSTIYRVAIYKPRLSPLITKPT